MCFVSMVGDHFRDQFSQRNWFTDFNQFQALPAVSRQEFDELKREVEGMKALLKRAKEYDERNGEPECEVDEKMDLLRKVAKLVGIELDDVLDKVAK
jgi:hypothetical protein